MNLCQFKDIFGKPKQGPHSIRFMNIAIVDVLAVVGITYYISKQYKYKFMNILLPMFGLGIAAHRIFCVRTTIDKILFP